MGRHGAGLGPGPWSTGAAARLGPDKGLSYGKTRWGLRMTGHAVLSWPQARCQRPETG